MTSSEKLELFELLSKIKNNQVYLRLRIGDIIKLNIQCDYRDDDCRKICKFVLFTLKLDHEVIREMSAGIPVVILTYLCLI